MIVIKDVLPYSAQRCGNLGTLIRDDRWMTWCICPPGITGSACEVVEVRHRITILCISCGVIVLPKTDFYSVLLS